MTQSPRPATPQDFNAIDLLLRAAFKGNEEVHLMRRLRRDRAVRAEYVFSLDDRIIVHAALSDMVAPVGWLALAPVSVAPGHQFQGFGSTLVRAILGTASTPVVVLGDPAYYGRFGFDTGRAAAMTSPYPIAHTAVFLPAGASVTGTESLVYANTFGIAD